jgi:hypothetical protein
MRRQNRPLYAARASQCNHGRVAEGCSIARRQEAREQGASAIGMHCLNVCRQHARLGQVIVQDVTHRTQHWPVPCLASRVHHRASIQAQARDRRESVLNSGLAVGMLENPELSVSKHQEHVGSRYIFQGAARRRDLTWLQTSCCSIWSARLGNLKLVTVPAALPPACATPKRFPAATSLVRPSRIF